MRVCIFVDGENFRHSIVELFDNFHQEDYLPKRANWTNLFDWLVKEAVIGGERVRTYWYVVQSLTYSPYRIPNPASSSNPAQTYEELHKMLSRHYQYKKRIDRASDKNACMDNISKGIEQYRETMRRRFSGWIEVQDNISLHHTAIEFRRAGTLTCNLIQRNLANEKAVDVKLATDMITLEHIYDVAIIVSGDQDYVPAVKVLKDYGKSVVNIAFQTRSGVLLPGGARKLNQVTDWSSTIPYKPLAEHLQIDQLPLPS